MPESLTLPDVGRIDLHSHLLPGIDDGCHTVSESLICVEMLIEQGFCGTVCTPHIVLNLYPNNTPANIAIAVERLQEAIDREGLAYRLWPGGEVRIHEDTISWFEAVGIPTLGPGKSVLLDWWGHGWPRFANEIFRYLLDRGYQPILAHPERMGFDDEQLSVVLKTLRRMGVRLQGNFNSISGGEGPAAEECAKRLLAEGAYDFLASDMHRPHSLEGRFQGLHWLTEELGAEKLKGTLERRTRALLR